MSIQPLMRVNAITRFGPDAFAMQEAPRPVAGPGQLLVRNHAAGVNNIDLIIRRGELAAAATPLPHVPGVEGAGVVVDVGEGVTGFRPGQRVMWLGRLGAGGYGEFTAIDARYAAEIGEAVPFEVAAAAPVAYATAHHMLHNYAALKPRAWVLVRSAAGGVGTAALQLARNAGLRAIALAGAGKLEFAKVNGAAEAFDPKAGRVLDEVMAATGARGVDLALNAVAGDTILEDLELLAPFGLLVSFGHLGGLPTGSAADLLMPYFGKSVGIRVSDLYTYYDEDPDGMSATLRRIAEDLNLGRIAPQVFAVEPLEAAAEAHARLESGQVRGKLVLEVG